MFTIGLYKSEACRITVNTMFLEARGVLARRMVSKADSTDSLLPLPLRLDGVCMTSERDDAGARAAT